MVLNESMASTNTITTEHDEVRLNVVSRVLEDVMERENVGATAQSAFTPRQVEQAKKLGITNARLRLRVGGHQVSHVLARSGNPYR